MLKKTILIILSLVVITGAVYWVYKTKTSVVPLDNTPALNGETFNPLNATYVIEDEPIILINGKAEKEIAPGSSSKIEAMVWGEPAKGDLTGDGEDDAALIITYSTGGSGTFYYIAAAFYDPQTEKTIGTNGILLGDRVAIQNILIDQRGIIVNYADREKDQAMIIQPSIGITKHFQIGGSLLEETTQPEAIREQGCSLSGGILKDSLCCQSASDFPNSCLIGACGCSPDNSHQVKVCDCGTDKCFDGKNCVNIE